MKRFLTCFLLPVFLYASAQQSIDLSDPESGTKEHVARDYIRFLPGYHYKATGTNTMRAAIDEHLVIPTTYRSQPPSPFQIRELSTSYTVGAIAGSANVSPTGAATYQIPIAIPPGTGGVQPNISIVYNSQAGNGLLGYGWNLAGVSAISRSGKTFYHDGKAEAVKLDNTDNLMMDGQRLMLISASATNLVNGAEYRTEIETFSEIKCKTTGSNLFFEVKTKDGWILEYGSTADAYIEASGSSVALYWLLAKATDPSGNYMTYTYTEDNAAGEFRLKLIDYTGNTGLSPYNRVEFFYETRTDQQTAHVAGKQTKQTILLKRIKASSANTTFREYKLNYYFDGMYSKLTEVEEYGQNGERYNSTVVSFINVNEIFHGTDDLIFISPKGGETVSVYTDFNNDGKTDFICYPKKTSYTASDVATIYLAGDYYGLYFSKTTATIPLVAGFTHLLSGDMDGDGMCDVIRVYKSGSTYYYNIYLYKNGAFTFYRTQTSSGIDCMIGDFNGDGRQDMFFKAELRAYSYTGSVIATGGISAADAGIDYIENVFPNSRYVMNLTGSGKTSILTLTGSSCKVFELTGSTFNEITTFVTTNVTNRDGILPGDYNGDGLTDLLIQRNNSQYYILFSTGKSFVRVDQPDLKLHSLTLQGDINRDGKTDIVQLYASTDAYGGDPKMHTRTGICNGNSFTFDTGEFPYIPVLSVPIVGMLYDYATGRILRQPDRAFFTFEDFNGDGRAELMYDKAVDGFYYKSFYDPLHLQVHSITDGLNRRTEFSYLPMTDAGICNENGTTPTFPVTNSKFPLYLVSSMNTSAADIYSSNYFYYRSPRTHRQGKGFLGFGSVEATDYNQNRKTITDYGYSTVYYNVYPTQQKVTTYSGSADISTVTFNNSYLYIGSKRIFPYVSQQTAVDHLVGLTVTTAYQYPAADHGNPKKITETRGSLVTETTNTWEAKGGSIFKNRLTESTVKRTGLQGTYTHTAGMDYDAKGRLTSQIDFKGTAKAVTTVYSDFDTFGNPQAVTTTAADCPAVGVTLEYDGYGRPVSRTDVTGTTATAYDPFGRVTSQTGIDGAAVSYRYDGFGNLIEETNPLSSIHYARVWDISGYQLYRTDRTEAGAPSQSVWYNAAGREVKTRTKGFSGDVYTQKEYNYKGQLYRSYLPGYGSPSGKYTEYTYDSFGRPASEISVGGTTAYAYNGLTATVTYPDGMFKTSTLNSSGLVETITDGGGDIGYAYNSLGKPVTVTAVGLKTTIRYDSRGYQTGLKDPDMTDTLRYDYDAYGMLRSQTNARGQTAAFLYDAAGRMTSESRPEIDLTYHYVASGAAKGQPEYVKTGGAELRKIAYNALGLPEQVSETIDGTEYVTKYTYDSYGRPLQKESPSGFKLMHEYNSDGYLTTLRDGSNNAILWQADATNAFGQITSSTLGNGLTRNTAYNPGNLTLQGITLINGAAPIDDIAYDFTPASGNLQQRNDVTNARNEVFGYDALNRLGSINLNNTGAKSITYEPGGNIKTKFDVGTYQYANGNHAVSGISPLAAGYTPPSFSLTHTSFDRPATMTQGTQKLTIAYGPDRQRNVSSYHVNNVLQTTRYYNGDYEKEVSGSTTKEYDYVYSPEGLTAIAVKTGSARTLYYAHTDHLGSLRVLTDANKSTISRYRYDAWGQRTLISGTDITNRGFTMHEHVDAFGLINMNARLYDPMMGRFLSPDPFVQMPDFTQSYNRYSYALNNPLIYTDPSGEFLLGFIAGFWKGVFTWKNPFKTAWQGGVNETKIWAGLFVSDKNKDLGGQIWEVVSRFTWQLPQTILGIGFSHLSNYAGQIDNVDYEGGATVSSGNYWGQGDGAAITLGSYITGGRSLDDDPNNSLFQHEYGHYIQSQRTGWGYLVSHGIPSLISAAKDEPGYDHDDFWTEQDANKKAYEYFYSKMGSKLIWYFGDNPINDANWVNAVQSKYSKNAMQSNYWRSHQTVYTPMPSYPFNYFNWNHTRQGIDDYRRNTHRSDGSSVRSLKELLLLYKR